MLNPNSIFQLFEEKSDNEIVPISISNELTPSLLIKLFKKIISNHILFSNTLVSSFIRNSPELIYEDVSKAGYYLIYTKAFKCISGININDENQILILDSLNENKELELCLLSSIEFFSSYEEYEKCASDIIYFTEHYAKFLTDAGPRLVDLRKYQVKYLNTLADQVWVDDIQDFGPKNRNFINCWSRQTSKCLGIDAKSLIKDDINSGEKIANLALLYYENKKRLTVLEKIKVWLIKLYNKLD